MIREEKIVLNGLKINYATGGEGQPIIFTHNGGGFWHSWEHQLQYFSEQYEVFGIDWPGFGESEAPENLIDLPLLTDILDAFIREKNLKNVILIGNCIGGSASLDYTQRKHADVDQLIIFNICPGNQIVKLPIMRKLLMRAKRKPQTKKWLSPILSFAAMKTPVRHQFPKRLFGPADMSNTPLFKRYEAKFKRQSQMVSRLKMLYAADTYNLDRYFDGKDIPKHMLVWADNNQVTSLEKHGYLHRDLMKPERFEILEKAGHLCMYDQPLAVNKLIESYLNQSESER